MKVWRTEQAFGVFGMGKKRAGAFAKFDLWKKDASIKAMKA